MQSQYHESIRSTRGCTLVPHCVLGQPATTSITGTGGTASVAMSGGGINVQCLGIQEVLAEHNFPVPDLLSIDIEGSEPSVLRCWNFSANGPRAVLIETNKAKVQEVDLFFHRNGYVNAETFIFGNRDSDWPWLDNLYLRSRSPMRHPPGGDCVGADNFCQAQPWARWPGRDYANPWLCDASQ